MSIDSRLTLVGNRVKTLGNLVWKIPGVEETGYSQHKIEFATSMLTEPSSIIKLPNWNDLCEMMFVALLGGTKKFEKDFEYVYWKWVEWVFKEENLVDTPEPNPPEIVRPGWLS